MGGILDQSEIERLLSGGMGGGGESASAQADESTNSSMNQSELEALFSGLGGGASSQPAPNPQPTKPQKTQPSFAPPTMPSMMSGGMGGAASMIDEEGVPQGDIDYILKRAEDAVQSIAAAPSELPSEVIEFQFPEFGGTIPSSDHATLDQISEVELDVKIELGRANMYLEDVLKLRKGSVVPLDKMAGDAVDIYVNGRLLARGEVLVMNENFCVRIAELLAGSIPIE